MPRLMRRATAKLFPHKSPENAGGHHGTRRNHEGARALLASYRGTTSAGPVTTGDDDAPASPSICNPAAGRRGRLSRFMWSFRPRREASAVREVRASAPFQREQDSDLRDSTLNLDRLAASRAPDGTATTPFSLSQTQVSPATSRGPLGNNEPGAHAAPAAVTQARAAPVATETRTLGDGCAGSASQTARQSSQVDDRLSNAPPYVGLAQDPSMAAAFSTALDTSIIRDDDTHVLYSTEHISDEAFPGTRLRIRVSSGRALGNRSQPLDHAIRMLCVILRGQQHHLTQLHLTIKHSRVVGGQCDGIDTVVALLSGVKNHLHCFLSAHVKYVCEQDEQPGQRVARDISNAFCKLLRLKIEGSTTSSRLIVFPLRHLRHLEILMKISEMDVGILLRVCRSLDVLAIRSAASTHNGLESALGTLSGQTAFYPAVMHLEGDHFSADLVRDVPIQTDLRMTISQFCPHFVELVSAVKSSVHPMSRSLRVVRNAVV